jgi:hypothetical protein
MELDTSPPLALGPGLIGTYSGPDWMAIAPVTALTNPVTALSIAKARSAVAIIDSVRLHYSSSDLGGYRLLYRFAICDTIPPLPRSPVSSL